MRSSRHPEKNSSPKLQSSWLSRTYFWWTHSLLKRGYKENLREEDLWTLDRNYQCKYTSDTFETNWRKQSHADHKHLTTHILRGPLSKCILQTFKWDWIKLISLRLCHLLFGWLGGTYLLRLLIESMESDEVFGLSFMLSIFVFIVYQLNSISFNHVLYTQHNLERRIFSLISSLLYKKSLKISSQVRDKYSIGEISNLLSSDAEQFSWYCCQFVFCALSFLHIPVSCYFLFYYMGISALSGVLALLSFVPMSTYINNQLRKCDEKKCELQDKKMELLTDMLNGIKVIKLNGMENYFAKKLTLAREKQLDCITEGCFYKSCNTFFWTIAPFLVSVLMFLTYILWQGSSYLDAKTVFITIGMMGQLRYGVNEFPESICNIIKAATSLRRLQNFLMEKELPEPSLEEDSRVQVGEVVMKDAKFQWEEDAPVLQIENLKIPNGSLVAIVGRVGAGKSTILSAILGEIPKLSGNVYTKGSLSYVPQQAWIQNETLQNNILFGDKLYETKYENVLDACALVPDLDLLPAGDQMEIGERGINLSGGQKQRVCLARSIYTDSDIYLFDDPLSAVDGHVGRHLFNHVISNNGPLKDKTRILVTHNLSYLDRVDKIYLVQDRTVKQVNIDEISTILTLNGNGLNIKVQNEETEHSEEKITNKQVKTSTSTLDGGKFIEEESVHQGKVQWSVYKEYIEAAGKWQAMTVAASFFGFWMFYLAANVWLTGWTDTLEEAQKHPDTTEDMLHQINIFHLTGYCGYGVILVVLILLFCVALNKVTLDSSRKIHQELVTSILRSPFSFFEKTPIGRITARFQFSSIDDDIPMAFACFLDSLSNTLMGVIVMCYASIEILFFVIPLFIVYLSIQQYYFKTANQLRRMMTKTFAAVTSYFTETLLGCEVIRAFKVQNRFQSEFNSKCDKNFNSHYHKDLCNRWIDIRLSLICTILMALSVFLVMVTSSSASSGLIGLTMVFICEFGGNFVWFIIVCSNLDNDIISVERISEFIKSPNEADWESGSVAVPKSWPQKGRIRVEDLCVAYKEDENVLHSISFTINSNEKVGIVGRTGAGKSSLMLSFFRLTEPSGGAIFIDDVNIGHLGLHELRSRISIIPQDPVLFLGSIKMNLDPTGQYEDGEIWVALKQTYLYDTIHSLPLQLESQCGEGGNKFSVGQRQLLCLARVLLRKSKILILDEATAAVDLKTDELIQMTLRSEFQDCTVLTIAHRINTVLDYDRILVLNKGRVADFDTPQKLLENKSGIFYDLAKTAKMADNS